MLRQFPSQTFCLRLTFRFERKHSLVTTREILSGASMDAWQSTVSEQQKQTSIGGFPVICSWSSRSSFGRQ
jgi:hypothetical protein